MIFQNLFNSSKAIELGVALAHHFTLPAKPLVDGGKKSDALKELLDQADREVRPLGLSFINRAKFANSFKWKLLDGGIDKRTADEITRTLVVHLSVNRPSPRIADDSIATPAPLRNRKYLLNEGNRRMAEGALAEAIGFYEELIKLDPHHAIALNNLGSALCTLGRYNEAEYHFRRAIKLEPNFADAHANIGYVLRATGRVTESESWLRQALTLKPTLLDARNNLGLSLTFLGRLRDANGQFRKVLKRAPQNADALFGLGYVAGIEGRFDDAEALLTRALKSNPRLPGAWAALAEIRRLSPADRAWLEAAEELAASGIAPLDEAALRFAIGKCHDDLEEFKKAFQSYERGNNLLKTAARPYDRTARTGFVDDIRRVYTRENCDRLMPGASESVQPIFVVGMPRSGTSLTEQIIASHPSAAGCGELPYWSSAVAEHETSIRSRPLEESTRKRIARGYLQVLREHAGDTTRTVDKAPINSDYLGLIYSIFPNARIIYMRRDPIDTCLSCYFQKFFHLNFTMDLADLTHYYQEHRRLMAHWRDVLPAGTLLDVPYEGLVAHQEEWTRKILDFVGLEWHPQCLNFHKTDRPVLTSSFWQVRQAIYDRSVARWRNYKPHLGPLLSLANTPF